MKKLFSLLVGLAIASTSLYADFIWKPGYVILNSGDSVKGDVHINTKKELALFSKVQLKQGDNLKTYKPDQVREFGYDDVKFLARKVDGDMQFLKVLSFGRVLLFELQFEMQRGNDLVVDSDYYIQKNDGSDADLSKVKSGKFKKIVADMMADNADLVTRVQNDDKKYEINDMQKVVDEYNDWYKGQNSTSSSSGTR